MISGKGVHMNKGLGVRFADFFYFILFKYPMKMNNLVSLRPNYFIFIGYLKMGVGEGVSIQAPEPRLNPRLVFHVFTFNKSQGRSLIRWPREPKVPQLSFPGPLQEHNMKLHIKPQSSRCNNLKPEKLL